MTLEIAKEIKLSIPLASADIATLAYKVLSVDKELKRSNVSKEINTDGENLIVNFKGSDLKKLRVSVNGFLKNVKLIVKTVDQFIDK